MMRHGPTATASVMQRRMVWCCRPQTTDFGAVIVGLCVFICGTLHNLDTSWRLLVTCFKIMHTVSRSLFNVFQMNARNPQATLISFLVLWCHYKLYSIL
jgi:hypothetical protein